MNQCSTSRGQHLAGLEDEILFPHLAKTQLEMGKQGMSEDAHCLGKSSTAPNTCVDDHLGAAVAVSAGGAVLASKKQNTNKGQNEQQMLDRMPKRLSGEIVKLKNNGRATKDQRVNTKPWVTLFRDNRTPLQCTELHEVLPKGKKGKTGSCELYEEDLLPMETAWGHSLVGYFAGNFPGTWSIANMTKGWGVPVKHHAHRSGWLVFKFESEKDMTGILEGGPYFAEQQPLILKPVPQLFRYEDEEMKLMPVWISLPRLPKVCWGTESMSKIVSQVGKPLRMDKRTSKLDAFSYARALVIVDASEELTTQVNVTISGKATFTQDITYDYMPKYCTICKCIGHMSDNCKKKNVVDLDFVDEVHTLYVPVETAQVTKVVQDVLDPGRTVAPNSGQKGIGCVATEKVVKENVGTENIEDVEVHTDSSDSGYEASENGEGTQELCLESDSEESEESEDSEGSHEHQEEAKSDREECLKLEKASQGMEPGISESTEKEPVQVSDTVTYDVNKLGVVTVTHSMDVNNQENDIPIGSTKIVDGIEYELIEVDEPEPPYQTRNRSGPYRGNRGGRFRGVRGRGHKPGERAGRMYYC